MSAAPFTEVRDELLAGHHPAESVKSESESVEYQGLLPKPVIRGGGNGRASGATVDGRNLEEGEQETG